jgi:hypothetical protein
MSQEMAVNAALWQLVIDLEELRLGLALFGV